MKKTEAKTKSSKADKARGVSVSKKPVKPTPKSATSELPKNAVKVPEKKVVVVQTPGFSKNVPVRKEISSPPRGRRRSKPAPVPKGPKPIPVHKNGPALIPSLATKSLAAKSAQFEKKTGKDKNASKSKTPMKLVQVVPKQKPNIVHSLPVKKEKMLMRFGKPTKRVLYTVDFLLKASPTILYHFMTTPSCLVRWFCDAVDITNEYYTFSWNGNTEVAELLDDIEDERLRFTWLDGEDEDEFFEFRISTADITDETILEIIDFAWADEVEEQKELWKTQVDKLRKETGDA